MDSTTILTRSDKVTFQKVAEEAILIHMETGTYFSLNDIGTEFWEMFDGKQSIQELAATVAKKYDVKTEIVVSDLLELVEKLAVDQLVLEVN